MAIHVILIGKSPRRIAALFFCYQWISHLYTYFGTEGILSQTKMAVDGLL